jgi:hypothetical protein
MTYVPEILGLSFGITFVITFLCMLGGGIKHRKIYYEPNCPPVPFRDRPFAFLALCALYVSLATGSGWIVVLFGKRLLNIQ